MKANRLIEDKFSTYSYWAGFFSNATEIHVDVRYHGVLEDKRYVYHDEKSRVYFGKYSNNSSKNRKILFDEYPNVNFTVVL